MIASRAAVAIRKVEIEADVDGLEVIVKVRRFAIGIHPFGGHPSAFDVPQDVRNALRAWLDTAEPKP